MLHNSILLQPTFGPLTCVVVNLWVMLNLGFSYELCNKFLVQLLTWLWRKAWLLKCRWKISAELACSCSNVRSFAGATLISSSLTVWSCSVGWKLNEAKSCTPRRRFAASSTLSRSNLLWLPATWVLRLAGCFMRIRCRRILSRYSQLTALAVFWIIRVLEMCGTTPLSCLFL